MRGKCIFESKIETENMPYIDKTDTLYASYEFETKTKTLKSTGPTLFEVQAKWVLRNPTQFAFLSARNS